MVGRGRRTGHKVRGLVTDSLEQNVLFLFYFPVDSLGPGVGGREREANSLIARPDFRLGKEDPGSIALFESASPPLPLWLPVVHP